MYQPTRSELSVSRLSKVSILQTYLLTDATVNITSCVVISSFVVVVFFVECSELTDAILELDIFNLSSTTDSGVKRSSAPAPKRAGEADEEFDIDESRSLFWQPGKHGFYSPRPGKNTPERLNAFRNVGRYVFNPVVIVLVCAVNCLRRLVSESTCVEWDVKLYSYVSQWRPRVCTGESRK